MSKVDNLLIGSVGISNGPGQAPTVLLFPNGTVSAVNFTANINSNVSFNAPLANATFEKLFLSNIDPAFDQTADRITVDFNDGAGAEDFQFSLTSSGALVMEETGVGSSWIIDRSGGITIEQSPEINIGSTALPNTERFYLPDDTGAIALYNTANSQYIWRIGPQGVFSTLSNGGIPQFTVDFASLNYSGNVNVAGNIIAQGYIDEVETIATVTTQTPINLSGSLENAQVLINVTGGTAIQYNAVLLPVTGRVGQTVKVVLESPGSGFPIVQTTSPAGFQFRGQGQVFGAGGVNLMNGRAGGLSTQNYVATFTYTNYGGAQDDWLFQVS